MMGVWVFIQNLLSFGRADRMSTHSSLRDFFYAQRGFEHVHPEGESLRGAFAQLEMLRHGQHEPAGSGRADHERFGCGVSKSQDTSLTWARAMCSVLPSADLRSSGPHAKWRNADRPVSRLTRPSINRVSAYQAHPAPRSSRPACAWDSHERFR